jgi:hypothetical protein
MAPDAVSARDENNPVGHHMSLSKTAFLGSTHARYILLAIIVVGAFAIRLYRIDSPLWLDELYGYRLATLGPEAIVENSWTDPHPPLYYLVQWGLSGSGQLKTEIGWRWLPLLTGTLSVLVIWLMVRNLVGLFASLVFSLVAATSPSLVFCSQDARPMALLVLVASLSMWSTVAILRDGSRVSLWVTWAALSLAGLYTGYVYVVVAGIQLLFLGFYYHRRIAWWVAATTMAGSSLLLFPLAASSLGRVSSIHTHSNPLTFWRTLQTLFAGEPLRYGVSPSHTIFPVLTLGLIAISIIRAIRLRDKRLSYFILQVAVPMGAFFIGSPLLGIRLPVPEAKQFLVLFPALLILMASGLAELHWWLAGFRRGAVLLVTVACGTILFLNANGLHSYWNNPKSPEGLAVLRFRDRQQAGENVVSLHYSTTHALAFYTSGVSILLDPRQNADTYEYRVTSSEQVFKPPSATIHYKETDDIRSGGQFWILAHNIAYREPIQSLVTGCQVMEKEPFSARHAAFELMKVECPAQD